MKRPVVVFDVDGVLLDYDGGFERHMINSPVIDPKAEDYHTRYDIPREEIVERIKQFNETRPEFMDLEPRGGVVNDVEKLIAEGYDIYCVTACGESEWSRLARTQNLKNLFGSSFVEVVFCPLYGDKTEELQRIFDLYGKGYYFDDSLTHVKAANNIGYWTGWVLTDYNGPIQERTEVPGVIKNVHHQEMVELINLHQVHERMQEEIIAIYFEKFL